MGEMADPLRRRKQIDRCDRLFDLAGQARYPIARQPRPAVDAAIVSLMGQMILVDTLLACDQAWPGRPWVAV